MMRPSTLGDIMFSAAIDLIIDCATLAGISEIRTATAMFAATLYRVRPVDFFEIRESNDFEIVIGRFLRIDPDHPAATRAREALALCRAA